MKKKQVDRPKIYQNWMTEAMAMRRRLVGCPLSVEAQAMWSYLMYRLNAAFWRQPMCLAIGEIAGSLMISSKRARRARHELSEKGFILFEQPQGQPFGFYYMMSCQMPGEIIQCRTPEDVLRDQIAKAADVEEA